MKCPSLRSSCPPPAQWTMNASRMMAKMTTTNQMKNMMMPGTAYPPTLLGLDAAVSYPHPPDLFRAHRQVKVVQASEELPRRAFRVAVPHHRHDAARIDHG